jgi:hypothetical protein
MVQVYDWAEIADNRINKYVDFSKVIDKESYKEELQRTLSTTTTGRNILNAGHGKKSRGLINFDEIADEMFNGEASQKAMDNISKGIVTVHHKFTKEKRKSVGLNKLYSQEIVKPRSFKGAKTTQRGQNRVVTQISNTITREVYTNGQTIYRGEKGRFISFKEE